MSYEYKGKWRNQGESREMIVVGQIYKAKDSGCHYKVLDIVGKVHRLYMLSEPGAIYNLYAEEIARDFKLVCQSIWSPLTGRDKVAAIFDEGNMSSKRDHNGNWISAKEWDKLYCSCSEKEEKMLNIWGETLKVCLKCHKEIIK